jgi:AcrR family transcriptional regulator
MAETLELPSRNADTDPPHVLHDDRSVNATKARIRQTAARLIARNGILGVSMQGIARAMHLHGNTLAPYYGGREELLADIMVSHLDTLMRRVCDAYDRTKRNAPEQRLEAIVDAFLGCVLEERSEHRLLLRSGDVLDARGQVSVCGRYRSLAGLYAEVLEAAAPGVTPAAAMVAAMSLLAAMSCAALWFSENGVVGEAAYARMLTTMAMVGVKQPGLGIEAAEVEDSILGGKTP